jgi:hypothetical protein
MAKSKMVLKKGTIQMAIAYPGVTAPVEHELELEFEKVEKKKYVAGNFYILEDDSGDLFRVSMEEEAKIEDELYQILLEGNRIRVVFETPAKPRGGRWRWAYNIKMIKR